MTWELLVLVSLFLAGIGASLHRYILRDEHVISYGFLFTFLSGLCFLPALVLEPIVLPATAGGWVAVAAAAVLWFTVNIICFTGVSKTESTLGKPLASSKVLFVVILSVLVLGEGINEMKVIGTLLLIVGMLVLTWKKGWIGYLKNEGVQLTLAAVLITSVITILDKFNMGQVSPNIYGFMMYMVPATLLGVMVSFRVPKLKQTIRHKGKAIVLVALAYGAMYYFLLNAYRMAEVNVVYPIYQLNTLITMGLGYGWLGEKAQFRQRIVGALLMIAGAALVALGA